MLAGIYPISQVREAFSAIRYLGERINIVNILHLQHPEPPSKEWSPYDICEGKVYILLRWCGLFILVYWSMNISKILKNYCHSIVIVIPSNILTISFLNRNCTKTVSTWCITYPELNYYTAYPYFSNYFILLNMLNAA